MPKYKNPLIDDNFNGNDDHIDALKDRVNALEVTLFDIATAADCCTCTSVLGWHGRGHSFGCPKGDAAAALGVSTMRRLHREAKKEV